MNHSQLSIALTDDYPVILPPPGESPILLLLEFEHPRNPDERGQAWVIAIDSDIRSGTTFKS